MLQYLHQSAMLSNYFDYKKAGSELLSFFRQVSYNDYIVLMHSVLWKYLAFNITKVTFVCPVKHVLFVTLLSLNKKT
jgi:hypothetical protein